MAKSLISVDELSGADIENIYKKADKFFNKPKFSQELKNKLLVNFFFENSTRTRLSFEIAAKRMGMEVVNVDISLSSLKKGETIADMSRTVNAMRPDFVAIRHNSSGVVDLLQKYFDCCVINAGDGTNEHPTQALLDGFVVRQNKGKIKGLNLAICGDILHSRVARSNIKLFHKLGANISLITPNTLMPNGFKSWFDKKYNAKTYNCLESGIKNADIVMMLRIQQERMRGCYIASMAEYFKVFGLDHKKLELANKNAMVLHPGPINRDVEISSDLANDSQKNLILTQVEAGLAIRRSLMSYLA